MLLGSVFDSYSLGQWIYDWSAFYHGPATPISEMAGELWLLLIQLAGKVKLAEENIEFVKDDYEKDMIEDFLESGERLWIMFAKLLKQCEDYMWKAVKNENSGRKPLTMFQNSGCDFIDTIFGRDRELKKTEKLMTRLRLWSVRFDHNLIADDKATLSMRGVDRKSKLRYMENNAARYISMRCGGKESSYQSHDTRDRPRRAPQRSYTIAERDRPRKAPQRSYTIAERDRPIADEQRYVHGSKPSPSSQTKPDTARTYRVDTRAPARPRRMEDYVTRYS
jgi:hypothetical protein